MPFNRDIFKVMTVIAVAALVLAARFFIIDPPMAITLIVKYGYWAVALTFIGFAVSLAKQLPPKAKVLELGKTHRAGLVCILLAGAYLQVNEPREFKVLYDEFVISGVARDMYYYHAATYPARSHYFDGSLMTMEFGVDKRPFFFPFLISLVHDVAGYRPENVFYLNAGLAVILLLLVYALGFASGGVSLGCLGVLILTGLPLLAQNATGGGYELANLVMILLLYYSGSRYYRSSGAQGLNLFILTAVLLAQIRYESILYVLVVPTVALCKWCQEKRITLTWLAALSPLMLAMPLLVSERFASESLYLQTGPGQAFMSVHYFQGNAAAAFVYLFGLNLNNTNSVLLSVTGLFGVAYFLFLTRKNITHWFSQRSEDLVLLSISSITCINTILALCLSWGLWNDPVVARFSLPLQLLMLVLMLRSAARFLKSRPLPKWVLLFAGVWIALFAAPASARHYQTNHDITAREYSWFIEYLSHKDPATTLVVGGSIIGPVLYNMPTIGIGTARDSRWKIKTCLDRGVYREIIVLQRFKIDLNSGKYLETGPTQLGEGFKLETIDERVFHPDLITRISRIVGVDGTNGPAPVGLESRTHFLNANDYDAYLLNQLP
jgi:hypothetical protein